MYWLEVMADLQRCIRGARRGISVSPASGHWTVVVGSYGRRCALSALGLSRADRTGEWGHFTQVVWKVSRARAQPYILSRR